VFPTAIRLFTATFLGVSCPSVSTDGASPSTPEIASPIDPRVPSARPSGKSAEGVAIASYECSAVYMLEATPGEISGAGPQSVSPRVADSLAVRLLGGSRTRMGGLSISHARRVAARVRAKGELVFAVALLHDVIEKGRTTAEDLLVATGDARLVELVVILTRDEWESEEEYLSRCAADPIALQVKRADLEDKLVADGSNLSPTLELRLRRQAGTRLERLDALARRTSH